ncbi:hypothetical protein SEA_ENCELADUS_11 [Mycobacterium phage Enceladus]|uniref:Uncharacterized protein n=3 Tax=Bronvirus TaxID=1623278 RepID=E0YPE4_9CAUD|nr:head-tail connector protein [Mycobacterium phage LeBron]YP_010105413.1 head-tail connector protein [Mycobacterium phage DirkDirk]YP_010114711.1 head-tail connector protein [Mycobacterium phage OhShagHennessy]ASR85994.1 hypothetical protein SEA_APPLETREE2_11 [Mycobacterium phage Appletree2]QGJ93032.1 hypothetical protein SEA_ZARIA_11 [Mycobacterium phage Zaria]UEM46297.1 hypothetical protein SEA_ENCELADUS_11 [Mycobacterium phage Enceladus]WMI34606.1 hypothetical protein SEA_CALM_11 [Mycobac
MPAAGTTIGHQLTDIQVPTPNRALAAILLSPNMELLMQILGDEVVLAYRAGVAKRTGQLMRSAASQPKIGGKRNDRWVAHVTIGGEKAIAKWHSPRNPNPNDLFFYGVLHEHGDGGNPPSGWDFPAHDDLAKAVAVVKAKNGL